MTFCLRLGAPGTVDGAGLGASLDAGLGAGLPSDKIGGKARSLLRLAEAGLEVPPAVVVTTDLLAALRADGPPLPTSLTAPEALANLERAERALAAASWPEGFAVMLAREVDTLAPDPGARFAVRSSAAVEDDPDQLAAGLFLSRVDLARGEVLEAVRAVLGSALSPAAVAYLAQSGRRVEELGFAVLIHPFVEGEAAGAAAFDPRSSVPPAIEVHAGNPDALRPNAERRITDALRALASTHGPVEVEWVSSSGEVTFLQLRPYRRQARVTAARDGGGPDDRVGASGRRPSDPLAGGPGPSQGPGIGDDSWRWDAAHNPLPLSPAQAGLVAMVDERCAIGLRQRIVGGYLFYATDPGSSTTPLEPAEALRALGVSVAGRLALPAPTLEEALETFVAVYQPLFGVVQPNARAKRGALAAFLRHRGFDPLPLLPKLFTGVPSAATDRARRARELAMAASGEARQAALAAYLEEFGDEAPRWDVAAPTWREAPARLERLVLGANIGPPVGARAWRDAADAVSARLPEGARTEWEERLKVARAAAGVAEDDDVLYARIQAHVRQALLREGARLLARGVLGSPDEIFWLPLVTVRREARGEIALAYEDVAPLIVAAQRADVEARANPPPVGAADSADLGAGIVRGLPGAIGARIGRVRLYDLHHEHDQAADQILVARTLLPTELPLLAPAAIVVETGGVLDHVAAQARERGIPAVVGAVGACRLLREGDQVLVDGGAGMVVRLG
jgi:pyruvate,water dikinase